MFLGGRRKEIEMELLGKAAGSVIQDIVSIDRNLSVLQYMVQLADMDDS